MFLNAFDQQQKLKKKKRLVDAYCLSFKETVSEIAMKWTKVARTGATEARFNGVDVSTVMFTMPKGRDVLEVRFDFSC